MPLKGRSVDDLPLAAYSRGVDPEMGPPEMDVVAEAPADPLGATAGGAASAAIQLNHLKAAALLPVPDDERSRSSIGPTPFVRARAFARRNPRLVAGGGFVAMILIGLLLLGGGRPAPSAAGAVASPGAPTVAPIAADPGSATLVLTGGVTGNYTFSGNAGQPVAGSTVTAAWVDTLQNVLTLDGRVDRGTRTTDAGLVLTWGLVLDGKLVTFTSKAGECTIGMASTPKSVTGSFTCRRIKSDDGKLTVGATGTYRT